MILGYYTTTLQRIQLLDQSEAKKSVKDRFMHIYMDREVNLLVQQPCRGGQMKIEHHLCVNTRTAM